MRLWHRRTAEELPNQQHDFIPVTSVGELDALLAASDSQPILLFIHDPWCGISRGAVGQVESLGGTVYLLQTGNGRVDALALPPTDRCNERRVLAKRRRGNPSGWGLVDVAPANGMFKLHPARDRIFRELPSGASVYAVKLVLIAELPPDVNDAAS